MSKTYHSPFNIAVLAAGLGFFIDAFDLFLFNVYRIPSLKDLGLSGDDLRIAGEKLLAIQMAGMMIGGILSGIIADKKGRVTALFGSIILYSLCNIANGFVHDVNTYAIIRFLAGVGLAGELGAGITLVGESMSPEKRGYGTILVATLGALGAVAAGLAGDFLPWRSAFITAGIAGFLLLLMRVKSMETTMFEHAKKSNAEKGSFKLLFSSPTRIAKYFGCILMGVPIWYSVGILITLSPEIATLHHIDGLKLSTCFILFQIGIASGDLSSGIFSQYFKSRKRILIAYMLFAIAATILHFNKIYNSENLSLTSFLMGLGCGYLSVFVTSTAEHFGTNLRVTVTATVTNFMRGAVTLLIPLHQWIENKFNYSLTQGLATTGIIVWILALIPTLLLPETYGKNLEFIEE
ncbi:MAG TPA: MFS transporter [Bacteroidia bacterium]|nr:MFS transporter [Bacteroidia bacterium]HQK96988.1 MFS transporter [Bacteroidia bacterium]